MPHDRKKLHTMLCSLPSSHVLLISCYALALFDAVTIYDTPLTCSPTLDALRDAVNARLSDDVTIDLALLLTDMLDAHAYDDRAHLVVAHASDLISNR